MLFIGVSMAQDNYLWIKYSKNTQLVGVQHTFGQNWAMEVDLSAQYVRGANFKMCDISLTGLAQYRAPLGSGFSLVLGLGPSVSYLTAVESIPEITSPWAVSAVGQVGLEYAFPKLPFALIVELRPQLTVNPLGKVVPSAPLSFGICFAHPRTHKDVKDSDMQAYLL